MQGVHVPQDEERIRGGLLLSVLLSNRAHVTHPPAPPPRTGRAAFLCSPCGERHVRDPRVGGDASVLSNGAHVALHPR